MEQELLKYFSIIKIIPGNIELEKFKKFANLILEENEKYNLTGNLTFETIMKEHIIDSLSFNLVDINKYNIQDNFRLIDIGSGAGFPAIPLAILYPQAEIFAVESSKKKTNFIRLVAEKLELGNVSVLTDRVEELGHQEAFREKIDIVTARAVDKLNVLLEYAIPLLLMDRVFIAYKTEAEVKEPVKFDNALKLLGGRLEEVISYKLPAKELERNLIVFRKISKSPVKYPRSPGIPHKKPLK